MKTLICGGRAFSSYPFIESKLDELHASLKFSSVITGGAAGVDAFANCWAVKRGIPARVFFAEWSVYGKAAGWMRNARMLTEGQPDLVIAFPGGFGTADMVARARQEAIEVIRVEVVG